MTNLAQMVQDALMNCTEHSHKSCPLQRFIKIFGLVPWSILIPHLFQQVIVNLINNAIQAMETTSEKNLTVRELEVSGRAQVHVSDTGIGINQEIKNKIFEPFFTTKSHAQKKWV